MTVDTKVETLIINRLSKAKYDELKASGQLSDAELYITPDNEDFPIPTKVSELENDAGYLTEHQDISGKADKTEIPTKVSELENDLGYATNDVIDSKITNCITEIPQDIKLDLEEYTIYGWELPRILDVIYTKSATPQVNDKVYENGQEIGYVSQFSGSTMTAVATVGNGAGFPSGAELSFNRMSDYDSIETNVTLKAGSKVYVPNGFESDGTTPHFDEVVIESDVSRCYFGGSLGETLLFYVGDGNGIGQCITSKCQSGTTTSSNGYYYNTSTNTIYNNGISHSISLPIALITITTGAVTSIDQVFNGFGYIGSTIFALPGVKGLVPNGRNADGTLKNTEIVVSNVGTKQGSGSFTMEAIVEQNGYMQFNQITTVRNASEISSLGWYYSIEDNILGVYTPSTQTWTQTNSYVIGGTVDFVDSKITSFTPKLPFRAVDRNDSSWLSGLGMPSDDYIDLSFVKTPIGTYKYTAPANGYFYCGFVCGTSGSVIVLNRNGKSIEKRNNQGFNDSFGCECKKGDEIQVQVLTSAMYALNWQTFYYAEGEI